MDYGAAAWRHWQTFRPRAYASLTDPAAFFEALGERVADSVEWLAQGILSSEPVESDPIKRQRQILRARKQAEDILLPDEVFLPPEVGAQYNELAT